MSEHPEGRLELPAVDGVAAVLDDVDLAGLDLRGADLRGVKLRRAKLSGIDLRGADLGGASFGKADLRRAVLDEANLRFADLVGADLRGASLASVDCRGAMLEESRLGRAGMRFAKLDDATLEGADLRAADLWGASLAGVEAGGADLRGAILREADLRGADLAGANLRGTSLGKALLAKAGLRGADLRRATVEGVDFSDADLRDAKLQGLDLTSCNLARVRLSGTWLEKTRFGLDQVGDAVGEELAGEHDDARKAYLGLERLFQDLGDPDAASWAYRRKRRMQKLDALGRAQAARSRRDWRGAMTNYANYASDQVVEWVCDYGESIPRVLLSMLAVYVVFTLIYGVTGSVMHVEKTPAGVEVKTPTHRPIDLAIFSLMAMTTSGSSSAGLEPRDALVYLLTGLQALMGIALTGLLGFVMGNLVRR